ncbi:hypothetical protein K501DRAFT_300671 [Backusella circina FSU 941]|nr:hypothetical protein K501DRAFT_300671 [Backusella circina FSU 941]
MKQLPIEVLSEILLYLHQEDKVEFMLVCQLRERTIKNTSLFHTVHINSYAGFINLTKKIKKEPKQGAKVERLVFDLNSKFDIHLDKLLPLLSNLRVLLYSNYDNDSKVITDGTYPWHKRVQHIIQFPDNSINLPLVRDNICPNLTSISIIDSGHEIIPHLNNAPNLKVLNYCCDTITIRIIEQIHTNAPLLTALVIVRALFNTCHLDHDIIPAFPITKFVLEYTRLDQLNTEFELLHYFSMKYPNIAHFGYDNIGILPMRIEENVISGKDWTQLLNGWGPQFRKLHIDSPSRIVALFKGLDDTNHQLTELSYSPVLDRSIMEELVKSKQVHCIRSLKLGFVHCFNFKWLKKLAVLKNLTLGFDLGYEGSGVKFNEILESCSTSVESLTLQCAKLSPDGLSNISPVFIKTLAFEKVKIPKAMSEFMLKHFPLLMNLGFKLCDLGGMAFNLPFTSLNHLRIDDDFKMHNGIAVTTLVNCNNRYYTAKRGYAAGFFVESLGDGFDAPLYGAIKSQPRNAIKAKPYFTLTCFSVTHVILCDKGTYDNKETIIHPKSNNA